jgi:nickel transport protein
MILFAAWSRGAFQFRVAEIDLGAPGLKNPKAATSRRTPRAAPSDRMTFGAIMKHARFAIWLTASLLSLFACPRSASAHALGAECRLKGDKVHVEAYFEDDTPAQQAAVRVLDAEEHEIVKGQTDVKGFWSFDAPPPGRYQVIIDAGAGHRVVQKLTISERGIAGQTSQAPPAQVGDAPSREEFTSFPWLKVLLGVGTIAVLAAAFMLSRQASARRS